LISATDILAGNAEHLKATGPLGVEIAGLAVDSRQVAPGFLFAALPGTQVDGRDFIPAALKAGAAALLLPEGSRISVPSEVAVLTASNPRRAGTDGRAVRRRPAEDRRRGYRHQWQDLDHRFRSPALDPARPSSREPRHDRRLRAGL
jgi:hypothetical protein